MNVILLYISFLSAIFTTDNPKLTLNVSEFKSLKGELIIGIFNNEESFLKDDAAYKNYTITVDEASKTITIDNLPKGEYALSLYHDENSDNKCNLSFIGIPKEAYGFSNNIKPKFSAPSYKDCKFTLISDTEMNITLRH